MSAINWFEIPVQDMDRAVRFYEALIGRALKREVFMDVPHAIFQSSKDKDGVGGALIHDKNRKPAGSATCVYLDSSDIDASIKRATAIGGEVVQPKTSIGPMGSIALLKDTEGNLVGLHTEP
ncbi:MAG: Glyoxalase family protein [Myxococcaceae bacterium]|nr:Glyoxalase family protein [Myxococcaceae bacterium]